jgi:hypothetical protein
MVYRRSVAMLKHPICQNSMEIERDNNWNLLAKYLARFGQQISLYVKLVFGSQGTVQCKIDSV